MKIHFNVEYRTKWGEDLRVHITVVGTDGTRKDKVCPLETYDGVTWDGEITFAAKNVKCFEYKYALYTDDQLYWTEWELAPHVIYVDQACNYYDVNDSWRPIPDELPLFSSAYTDCVAHHDINPDMQYYNRTLQLRVMEPHLSTNHHLAIVGNVAQLGNWEKPVRMNVIALQEWAVNIDVSKLIHALEYKYVIVDKDNNIIQWEEGQNRRIHRIDLPVHHTLVKTDKSPVFKIDNWKCAGLVIPVFSIRTNKSYGVGDFGDLKKMIEWVAKVGMKAVQILPINDTTITHTWMDSYPYNSISIYAFHPQYCDLSQLGELDDKLMMEKFKMRQQELNALPQIDYEAVNECKRSYIKLIYEQNGKKVLQSKGFKAFFNDNKDWLVPYAAYSYLRDQYGTPVFSDWHSFSRYDKKEIDELCSEKSEHYHDIALYYYIQYQLHLQLTAVRDYAHKHGVLIKGDIPIGISRDSVEAWVEPFYFNLNGQAGAPPDAFSTNGQNWGFPTYNWDVMAGDGYHWWVRRFSKMAEYFDAYRIDHVLGFFRIWEIPMNAVHGLLGQFSPALPMSVNEMENYGFHFDKELMTRPYITDDTVNKIFGGQTDYVKVFYLDKRDDGRYNLKPEFDTQRKIEAAFKGKTEQDALNMRDGLYALVSDVLFVPDRKVASMYHPRISAQYDFCYRDLPVEQQQAFDRLYDDYFYHRHNQFWYEEAMKKLPKLTQATRMLVCAEDLGMVPDCVPWVMNQLRMLSLEIQTMPKNPAYDFGRLEENPYRSVATISTHDMPTMRGWWEEDSIRAQLFYNSALKKDGKAPENMPAWLCEEVVSRHLFSPSMLCLLSWQDWMAIDERLRLEDANAERINVPANPRHYWRYRMHLSVEQLLNEKELNNKIKNLITNSGR